MQVAYAPKMEITEQAKEESPRRLRRRLRLVQLLEEFGGVAQVGRELGTPKSHLSAMASGSRGLGDKLASKIEATYGKPTGWFDSATASAAITIPSGFVTASSEPSVELSKAVERIAWAISTSPHRGSDALAGVFASLCKDPENQLYIEVLEKLLSEKQDAPKKAASTAA